MLTLEQQQQLATGSSSAGGPGIADLLAIVKRRIWFLIIPLIVGAVAGLAATYFVHPKYEVSARIEVVDRGLLDKFYGVGSVTLPHKPFMAMLGPVVKNRAFLEPLIHQHGVNEGFEINDPKERLALYEAVINGLNVSIAKQELGSDIIDLSYRGRGAQTVTNFVDAVKTKMMERFIRDYGGTIDGVRTRARAQLVAAKEQLASAALVLQQFEENNDLRLVGDSIVPTIQEDLTNTESALINENAALAGKRRELESIIESLSGTRKTSVVSERVKNPARELKEKAIQVLEAELAELSGKFLPGHRDVKKKSAELARERAALADIPELVSKETESENKGFSELELQRAKVDGEIRKLEGTIRHLDGVISRLRVELKNAPDLRRRHQELLSIRNSAENLVASAEKGVNIADSAYRRLTTADSDFFNVLKAPRIEEARSLDPVFPNVALFLGGGAFVGLLLGVGTALVLEFTNRSYVSVGQVRRALPLPILGQVGAIRSKGESRARWRRRILLLVGVGAVFLAIAFAHWCFFEPGMRRHLHPVLFNLMQKIYGGR